MRGEVSRSGCQELQDQEEATTRSRLGESEACGNKQQVKAAAFRLAALVLADAERIREQVALALWGISR